MIGAIAGDIIGSAYEFNPVKTTDFDLFTPASRFTDDTVLTIATAWAILNGTDYQTAYRRFGREYPNAGYGQRFHSWLFSNDPKPYNSWANGAPMRVSPVALAFDDQDQMLAQARKTALCTHNHPQALNAAQALTLGIHMARNKASKTDIKNTIARRFGYNLEQKLADIRPAYSFDVSSAGSLPQAFIAFLESDDFESAVRNAVSLGGDADTLACMAGALAQAWYGRIPDDIETKVRKLLPAKLLDIVDSFYDRYQSS